MPCMALNRHREHGMRSSVPQSSNLVLMPVLMTLFVIFVRNTNKGCILLLLHVDDMIITGDDLTRITYLKVFLQHHFEMKDLGQLNFFPGLEVLSNSSGYYLSQAKYTSDLLARAGLTDS